MDGEVVSAMLGADYGREDWLVGVMLSRSDAEGGDSAGGELEASLGAATGYAAVEVSERVKVWGAAGHGAGELSYTAKGAHTIDTDLDWTMAAAGVRSALAGGEEGGAELALVSDAMWTRTSSDEAHTDAGTLKGATADVTRLRFGLEGGWPVALAGGGHFTPTVEVGVRHDGGDAETGLGVEAGAGIAWTDPSAGVSLDIEAHTLLSHADDAIAERGVSAALAFDPSPESARGPSLSVRYEAGAAAQGMDALLGADAITKRTGGAHDSTGRWTTEAAWGFCCHRRALHRKPDGAPGAHRRRA